MTISILGLGWLGSALAYDLVGKGHIVKGSTTSAGKIDDFSESNIQVCQYTLGQSLPQSLVESDVIVITIPPRGSDYIIGLENISKQIKSNTQVIYISSTSVYPNANKEVVEADAVYITSPHTGITLLSAEESYTKNKATCIRFAGLYGPDRHPGRFLAGKTNIAGANNPVNIIHRDDCIGLLNSIITKGIIGEKINGCSDHHPSKKEFYTRAAKLLSLKPPTFSTGPQPYKIISNAKSKSLLNYQYKFPDPLKALELI